MGGQDSDWQWGIPAKQVINSAGHGQRAWVVGGLTTSSYNDSEASWLQSRCFDFTTLSHPHVSFMVIWEMERRFDGAAFQYSIDEGVTWNDVGAPGDADCLNENWYNQSSITYLSALSNTRNGWSGNTRPTSGSCQGGGGSGGWVTASHSLLQLAGEPSVSFRFIFGAGSICNSFDGFAIDAFSITDAPQTVASFDFECISDKSVQFRSTSTNCPETYSWTFGDSDAGAANTSTEKDPIHQFSKAGKFEVSLTVNPGSSTPSTIIHEITILDANTVLLTPADCANNLGGSAKVVVTGGAGQYDYLWNTFPLQTTVIATNLPAGDYNVIVRQAGACEATSFISIPTDPTCIGVFFPTAFSPNGDGLNDLFGPMGSISILTDYSFRVYNRWGQEVFYSKNPMTKWNGIYGSLQQPTGVFVWRAEYTLPGFGKQINKGSVLLIR